MIEMIASLFRRKPANMETMVDWNETERQRMIGELARRDKRTKEIIAELGDRWLGHSMNRGQQKETK